MRNDRVADHAPALPSDRCRRTRQERSPWAERTAENCEAVAVRTSTRVAKVLEVPTCSVYDAAPLTSVQSKAADCVGVKRVPDAGDSKLGRRQRSQRDRVDRQRRVPGHACAGDRQRDGRGRGRVGGVDEDPGVR